MSTTFHGQWSDGAHLASRAVIVTCEGSVLEIAGLDAPSFIPLGQVRISDRLARVPRFLYLPGGASIETADNDAVDALVAPRGRQRLNVVIDWLERRSRVAAAAAVLLVASVAGGVYFGLPVAARRAAQAVPANIERQAGEAALNTLSQMLGPSELNRTARQRVAQQMDRIVRARKLPAAPRLEYRAMGQFPNAFALPGGILVVSDELVKLATDDELAAVLAHETAHWQLRHGAQTVFRGSAALLVVTMVTGDLSTLTGFAASLPVLLLQRGYSREFEQEADDYAVATLKQANIDPRHLATILTKLERARPGAGVDYSYLSTHPSTQDRAKKIDPTGSYLLLVAKPAERALVTRSTEGMAVTENIDVPPRAIVQEPPEYPLAMRATKIQGSVTVQFIVAKDGTVHEPRIVRSTRQEFEEPVLTAIAQWRFEPGQRRGAPVNARAQIDVPFTLSEEITPAAPSDDRVESSDVVHREPLDYPASLLPTRTQAHVRLAMKIGPDGSVSSVILKSSTDHRFDPFAFGNARRWRFAPQRESDTTLQTREIDYVFRASPEPAAPSGVVEVRLRPVSY